MIHLSNVYYFIDKFDRDEILKLDKKINIIFRNYKVKNIDSEIRKIKNVCKLTNRKIFVAGDIKMAQKYRLDGVYIPAYDNKLNYINLNLNFCILYLYFFHYNLFLYMVHKYNVVLKYIQLLFYLNNLEY